MNLSQHSTHLLSKLFTVAKLENQHICPSMDEWVKKTWFMSTMEIYSAIRKTGVMSFVEEWMGPEISHRK